MKKLIPLCLALILALALAVPASAAESGGVSVQVNGETVAFPNAAPELKDGRTMVPMRAVLEALGATVDYDGGTQTVKAALGETSITHVIGEDKIIVDGDQVMTMDTVSYVKSGSTLVPLRFFSQALGYEVYWDAGARTAVVIDKDAAISEIDKSFTILNSLQAKQSQTLEGMALDMDFSGEAKVFDSINGDQTLPFSMGMSALYGAEAMNMEGTMDLSSLSALLAKAGGTELPEEAAAMLKDLSFKMIYGESLWMQIPALSQVLNLPEGEVWLKTADVPALSSMSFGTSTIGAALYAAAEMADAEVPVNIYDDLTEAAQLMTTLMGDDAFTKDGEDYSWNLDEDKSAGLAEALGAGSVSFPFTMEMTIKADGSCTFDMEASMDEMTMTITGSSSATAFSLKGYIQIKNVCDLTFQGEAKMSSSGKAPDAAPPADAEVLDLDELSATPMPLPELPAA